MVFRFIMTFTLLASLIGLTSCGGGKAAKSTDVNVVILGAIGGIPGQTGGTMIFGFNTSNGDFFSHVFQGTELILSNGVWDFATISWDGNAVGDVMRGTAVCGVAKGIELVGGDTTVNMILSSAGCNDQFFGQASTKETTGAIGQPKVFQPVNCTDGEAMWENNIVYCKDSVAESYRVIIPEEGPNAFGPGLISQCFDDATLTTPQMENATGVRVPMFQHPNAHFVMEVFDGPACTGSVARIPVHNAYNGWTVLDTADSANNALMFILDPCTMSKGLLSAPHSTNTSEYVLCTATQFDQGIDADPAGTYYMLRDLDFTGMSFANSIVGMTFTGELISDGFSLNNITINTNSTGNPIGIFSAIDGSLLLGSAIRRLALNNVSVTTVNESNVGALAGYVATGTSIDMIKAVNIDIDATGTSVANIGGLFGNIDTGIYSSQVWGITATDIYINAGNASNVGGVAGVMKQSTALRSTVVNGVVIDSDTAGDSGNGFGGAVGSISGNNSEIWGLVINNVKIGDPLGTYMPSGKTQIGGLAGINMGARVYSSKVNGAIYSSGGSQIGGFIGENRDDSQVVQDIADVDIFGTPTSDVGGFIGFSNHMAIYGYIDDNRAFGDVQCNNNCGGFIGRVTGTSGGGTTVYRSYSKGDVTTASTNPGANVGGFAGYVNNESGAMNISFNEIFSEGNVTAPGTAGNLGGLIGAASSVGNFSVGLTDAFSNGTVSGTGTRGGLIGYAHNVQIYTSYTSSTVSAGNECIGFADSSTLASNVFYLSASASDADCTNNITLANMNNMANFTNFNAAGTWQDVNPTSKPRLSFVLPIEAIGETYTGSEFDPIILTTPAQWNVIGDHPQLVNKNYRLGADLDFGNGAFTPVGSFANPFSGNLQGNNHTIRNVNFSETGTGGQPLGLIRVVGQDQWGGTGSISQWDLWDWHSSWALYLDNVHMSSDHGNVGVLAGEVYDSDGGGAHDRWYAAEISDVVVNNSSAHGGFSGTHGVGGVIGYVSMTNGYSEFSFITSNATVTAETGAAFSGGVFGKFEAMTGGFGGPSEAIQVVKFGGNVNTPANPNVGGIVGSVSTNAQTLVMEILDSTGNVSGGASTGGIAGLVGGSMSVTINMTYASGSVTGAAGSNSTGGIVGSLPSSSMVKSSLSKATVNGVTNVGCLVGNAVGNPVSDNNIANCPSVSGTTNVSYFTANPMNPGSNGSIYLGPVDENLSISITTYFTPTGGHLLDPAQTSAILFVGDPWILIPGQEPQMWYHYNPDFLNNF